MCIAFDFAALDQLIAWAAQDDALTRPARRQRSRNPRKRRKKPQVAVEPDRLAELLKPDGVDLSRKDHREAVRKIFYSKFSRRVRSAGYDPNDVLQEVYRGILARNAGTSAWDPSRGRSLTSYIYMVASGVVINYHAKMERRKHVTTGIMGYDSNDRWGLMDAGSVEIEDEGGFGADPEGWLDEGLGMSFWG